MNTKSAQMPSRASVTAAPVQRRASAGDGAGRASIYDFGCAASASPVQLRSFDQAIQLLHAGIARANAASVQREAGGQEPAGPSVHQAAAHGTQSGGGKLPHFGAIQKAFGSHDVGAVQAHVGGPAKDASDAMGARAYASGNHVAFAQAPDLHTAAHEAAHVVQQRAGVQLAGGVGKVGDAYERHADQVADAVVQGKSAQALLDGPAGSSPSGSAAHQAGPGAVQREGSGQHGGVGATTVDQISKLAWQGIGVFSAMGMPNASANLRHYLGNSGKLRSIDIHVLFGSNTIFKQKVERDMKAYALGKLNAAIASRQPVAFSSGQLNHYFEVGESADWYFAVGGCHYFITGSVSYDAASQRALVKASIKLKDRYNWDGGKSVDILGVTVTDEMMGRLHKAGVAKEFDFEAVGSHSFYFAHQQPGPQRN